jgi:hypothetical protein
MSQWCPILDPFRGTDSGTSSQLYIYITCSNFRMTSVAITGNMRSITIFPFTFAFGLNLLLGEVACADITSKATLATFGPSIGQISKTGSSETGIQSFLTASTTKSGMVATTNATVITPASALTVFGTPMESSVPGNGQTDETSTSMTTNATITSPTFAPTVFATPMEQSSVPGDTSTTPLEVCPGPSQIMNSSSTMEAIVQIQVSNFVGTVTVILTQTGSSMVPLGMESGTTSVAATTTEADGPNNTFATGITLPSQSNNSSNGFDPRSNFTASSNTTNGSFANLPSSPRTAFTVFTGDSHRHFNVPGMLSFLVFQVAVLSFL